MLAGGSEVGGLIADAAQRWGGRVPIVVGGVGHRDIDPNNGGLKTAITAECHRLKRRFGHSPFVVLSPLAEGADRLIAQIAVRELQADLIAVLPMPPEEYQRDFKTPELKQEFHKLLAQALYVKVAEVPKDTPSWKVDGDARNEQYARAGAIVTDHSHILFAIWDGKAARGKGGTADQVKWFERGFSPDIYALHGESRSRLDPAEPGRLIWIDKSSARVKPVDGPLAPGKANSNIGTILTRTNRYNKDVWKKRFHKVNRLASYAETSLDDYAITQSVYRASDTASARLAKKVRISDKDIYIFALIAIASFNIVSNRSFAPWLYLIVTLLMLGLAINVWWRSMDNRFLEYRGLAEAMRTLFFWRVSGVKGSVWAGYLARQAGVVHWIRQAVRTAEFLQDCHLEHNKLAAAPGGIEIAKAFWLADQRKWYAKKETEHLSAYRTWNWVSRLAIGASFAIAFLLAALTVLPLETEGSLWRDWVTPQPNADIWQGVLGLLAGGGVAARGFLSRRAHLELAKQYASQRQIFETASLMLDAIKTFPKPLTLSVIYGEIEAGKYQKPEDEPLLGAAFRAADIPSPKELYILEKLGKEALEEQSEWVWLRHSRPFELPS